MPVRSTRREALRGLGATAAAASLKPAQAQVNRPLRLGLIGCGGRGNSLAGQVVALKQRGEPVEVAAVCDIYQPRLERTATKFSAKYYQDSAVLLREAGVDAVIIATPDRLHVHQALEAVRAGKDVYCEKPLTHWAQFDLLKELLREVRKRKTVFQVGAQWVSNPIWTRAAEQIRKGAIGKVVHVQTGYFRHGDGGERGMPIDDPNAQTGRGLDWEAFQADAPKRPFTVSRFFQWRMYMDYSGGPSTDLYVHPMTRVYRAIQPGLPRKVVAVGGKYVYNGDRDVPDTFDLLIEYPQGMTVVVLGTLGNDTPIETVIRGTEGTVRFTGEAALEFTPQPGSKLTRRSIGYDVTVQDHLADFLRSIRARETPGADLELGYQVQVPLIMAMRSYVEGKVAYFDAATEQIRMG